MNTFNATVGEKILLTTHNWFLAPDGHEYRAVFGTVKGIRSDDEALGVKTNRHSANWYVEIGNMMIAGCQVFYSVRSDACNTGERLEEFTTAEGKVILNQLRSRIFDADATT